MMIRKWLFCLFLTFFSIVALAQEAATTTPPNTAANPPSYIPKTVQLGGQDWQLDNFQEDENLQLAEYTVKGENVKNWQQLFTIQNFKFTLNDQFTPKLFGDKEIEQLKKQKYKVDYKVLSSNDNEAVIEFRVLEPTAEQQDEIQRIIVTPSRKLLILHYVIKKEDMGDDARKNWSDAIQKFDVSQFK